MNQNLAAAYIFILLLLLCGCSEKAPEATSQDLTGNMLSGGYIAEHNGFLYYANHEDENKLYRMDDDFENKLKLSESSNFSPRLSIQFSDSKLFYLQNNISDTDEIVWTLYSYDLEQQSEVKILDENICSYTISGGLIYFSTLDTLGIYKAKLDGSKVQLIYDGAPFLSLSLQIIGERLFFGWDEALVSMDFDGSNLQTQCIYPYSMLVYGEDVYYIDMLTGKLCKVALSDADMLDASIVLTEKEIVSFTISESTLYYATIDDKIYRADLNGENHQFISSGSAPIVIDGYLFYYDKEDNMLCLSTDIHPTSPQIEFGYANTDGSKLIVLYDHEVEDNSSLTYFEYAIGDNGNVYEVKYSTYQERSAEDNGRQLAANFNNEPGCIYDAVGSAVVPDRTYMLLTKEEYEKMTIFQGVINPDEAVVSNEIKEKCADLANRNVKNGWVLYKYRNGYSVSMIEFESSDGDLLAWLVLEGEDAFQYCEFPAVLSEDNYSGWRLGDCGELSSDMFYVLCVTQKQQEITVYLGWYSEEVAAVSAVVFSPDGEPSKKTVCDRYIVY